MTSLPIYQFDGRRWVEAPAQQPVHQLASFSVFSWNVWFHGAGSPEWLPRQQALLDEMRDSNADFLCLQEVTAPRSNKGPNSFLELLLQKNWFRSNYCVSDVDGATFLAWYGVIIASRLPLQRLQRIDFPSNGQGRYGLIAHIHLPENSSEKLAVGTAHLESPVGGASSATRQQQLTLTLEHFEAEGITTGLFMGDFNVTKEAPMKSVWDQHHWLDLNDGSSTWFSRSWRPDRMLMRSRSYVCDGGVAKVVGQSKTGFRVQGPDGTVETPSDHFALMATLRATGAAPHAPTPQFAQTSLCANSCGRMASGGFATCCKACADSAGRSHGPRCRASQIPLCDAQAVQLVQTWHLQKSQEAVAADSPQIFNDINATGDLRGISCSNVTDVVDALNKDPSLWLRGECYVYSTYKQSWFKLWKHSGAWSLRHTMKLGQVEPQLIFKESRAPAEAVNMLNRDQGLWPHNTCYVYSDYKGKWYQLWV